MLCASVLSMQAWAQAPAGPATSGNTAPTAQQPASAQDLKDLQDRIAKEEEALKQLQQSLAEQKQQLEKQAKQAAAAEQAAKDATAAQQAAAAQESAKAEKEKQSKPDSDGDEQYTSNELARNTSNKDVQYKNVSAAGGRNRQAPNEMAKPETSSPLGFNIGAATFTPLGFVDATYFFRSSNVGSGIGTNFAGVPYNNAAAGKLSENNFSAQNSRIGMRVDSKYMGWNVLGYLEADFLFNNNANSYQIGSNSAGMRLRNYFVDVNNGKYEFLGGQDWSMLTPNRKGLSPIPGDIFYTQNEDTNYQIGLIWTRAPQLRFILHPSKKLAVGLALENPQQYLGGGNGSAASTLPNALSSIIGQFQYSPGLNVANSITNVPNFMPDIQAKLAVDTHPTGDHNFHFEVAGVVSGYKDYILGSVATAGSGVVAGSHTAFGYGGEVNMNLALTKKVTVIENLFFSDGAGRYVFGSSPDLAVRPDGSISPLHTHSTVDGFEFQLNKNTALDLYYGGLYTQRDVFLDPRAVRSGGTATATPLYVGYGYGGFTGYAGPSAGQNRYVQEITADLVQTLWKSKNYGSLVLINQYSYVFREPWAEPAGTPRQAHTNMIYVNVRYNLP